MDSYLIPSHVYLCKTPDGIVFLNLRDDKYIGIGGVELPYLHQLIPGWPFDQVTAAPPAIQPRICQMAAELHRAGLLTTDRATGKTVQPVTLQKAESSIFEQPSLADPHVSPALLARIACAAILVSAILKFRSLESAINRIRARHGRATLPDGPATASTIMLTRKFFQLRPLLYSSRDRCLFDCLVLHEFLSGFGNIPTLVLGVTTFPFKAHCWLQSGPLVLTDHCETTRGYTPILAA